MRQLIISLALLLAPMATLCAQNDVNVSEKIGVLPEWVKNRTTPEEYALIQEMSQYYRLDCSFLKSRDLTDKVRKEIFDAYKEEIELARKGQVKLPDEPDRCYGFVGKLRPDSLRAYDEQPAVVKKYLIYSDINGYDAHVELSVAYTRNVKTGDIHLLGRELKAVSFSGLEVRLRPSTPDSQVEITYNRELNRFEYLYQGWLYFTDPEGEEHLDFYGSETACTLVP